MIQLYTGFISGGIKNNQPVESDLQDTIANPQLQDCNNALKPSGV